MNSIAMLRQQLHTVNLRLHHTAGDLTEAELTAVPVPGANPIAFILWHMVRSQDWAVNTAIRGRPELIKVEPWSWSLLAHPGIGTGFDTTEAHEVAREVELKPLLAYADAVHRNAVDWLESLSEADLDAIPDVAAHEAPYSEYQTPGFRVEMDCGPEHDDAVADKGGLAAWIFLTSVAVTHLHRHLGEADLIKGVLRKPTSARE